MAGLGVPFGAPRVSCVDPLHGTRPILVQMFTFLIHLGAENVFHLFPFVHGTKQIFHKYLVN